MRTNRLLPIAAVAGLAVGIGVAAFPGGGFADTRTGAQFTASEWQVVFGSTPVGSESAAHVVTITNTGQDGDALASAVVTGTNAKDFKIAADGCSGHTLRAGEHCDMSLVFAPTVSGTRVASIKFTDNTPCANWIHVAGGGSDATRSAPAAHAASCQGPDPTTVTTTTPTQTTTVSRTTTQTSTVTRTSTVATQQSERPQINTSGATKIIRLPARACHSQRVFTVHLAPPAGKTFHELKVQVNGRSFRVVRGKQVTSKIDLGGLPRGRFTLRIRASLLPSGTYVRVRHYVTCVPKTKKS
jgi:hypothetical protein